MHVLVVHEFCDFELHKIGVRLLVDLIDLKSLLRSFHFLRQQLQLLLELKPVQQLMGSLIELLLEPQQQELD